MRKIPHKLLMLIVIINFIGMILEGTTAIDNSKPTVINNATENNRLDIMEEKGVITVVSPLNDSTYFYLDTKTNKITGIDADIIFEIAKRL
jgi:polar amino acid transport system substrate-binding protein